MNSPLITVILPTYNGAAFLPEAFESIRAQNYAPLEILVMDDGSTDETEQMARAWNDVIFIAQEHRGRPAFGRNRGIQIARGEYIAFLDQDDVWTSNALAAQLAAFRNEPNLQVVIGRAQKQQRVAALWENDGAPLPQPFVSAALFRRKVFTHVGLFDQALEFFGDDTDWFARAHESKMPMKMLDAVTLRWRIHEHNASHQNLREHARGVDRPLIEIVKHALERKRAQRHL